MTKQEKKDLAQDALRYLVDLLPPERYGEDGRCEVIERALTQMAEDAEEVDYYDINDDPYIKGSYSGSSLELAILLLIVCWGLAMWALFG